MKDHNKLISTRSAIVYVGVILCILVILGQVFSLFLVKGSELRELGDKNAYRKREVSGIRGNIFSTHGELIATSIPVFTLRWDYQVLEKRFPGVLDTMAVGLADALKGSKAHYLAKLRQAITQNNRYYKLNEKTSYEQLKRLKSLPVFNENRYNNGLIIEEQTQRTYPYKDLAYRTIGLDREGTDGDVGIEGAYSKYLSGEKINRMERRISGGNYTPVEMNDNVEPKNGYDIYTTLNMQYQDVAQNALKNHLIAQKAMAGCAVLMEVNTGNILAMTNLSLSEGRLRETYNLAIGNQMEPGSTFKLATVLALLQDHKATLQDTAIIHNGVKYYYGQKMIDSHAEQGEQIFSLESAFEESSNAAISWFAFKHYAQKPEQFLSRLKAFNLNLTQEIEIPGEPTPFIKETSHTQWSKVSIPWMSIGYELMLTPLQILGFYNAVANNGEYVKPRFVLSAREGNKVHYQAEKEILNKEIASPDAIRQAKYLLEEVVREGTAEQAFRNSPYPVAGKTGTAQIHTTEQGYKGRQYNASFVGYFPADAPKYSCIVVVNRPSAGRYYASSVAVPVFKEIADKVYASDISIHKNTMDTMYRYHAYHYGYMDDLQALSANLTYKIIAVDSEWGSLVFDATGEAKVTSSFPQKGKVPNLKGLGLRDAIYLAEKAELKVRAEGSGKVIGQSPDPGEDTRKGAVISITLN